MGRYREYAVWKCLEPYIECFWSHETTGKTAHLVLPDGCVDVLLTRPLGRSQNLQLVGTMTQAQAFELGDAITLGVRFRPGMFPLFVRVPGPELVDQSMALEEIWGAKANNLNRRLSESSLTECIREIQGQLIKELDTQPKAQPLLSSTQQALSWAAGHGGNVKIEDLAGLTGLSTRQFRRVCLDLTGVTPKQLCRILRFRRIVAHLTQPATSDWANAALDCGYYDQAHFNNEFRTLAGITPGEYRSTLLSRRA